MLKNKIKNIICGGITASMIFSGTLMASAESFSFPDVPADNWAYPYITELTQQNIILGYDDGTFKPQTQLTQATFLALVMRAAYGTTQANGGVEWWRSVYDEALEKGLIDADEYPASSVNTTIIDRYSMARLINRVLQDQGVDFNAYETGATSFSSDYMSMDKDYKVPVRNCYMTGILTGYEDNYFHGERAMQRDSASAVICRMMDVLEKSAGTSPNIAEPGEKLPEFVVDRDGYVLHIEGTVYAIADQATYDDHIGKQPSELGVPAAGAMLEFFDMFPEDYKDAEVTARVYTDENGHYSIDYPGRIAGLYADSPLSGTSGGDWYWKFSKNYIPVKITYQDENGEYYSTVYSSQAYWEKEPEIIATQGIGVTAKEMPNISADLTCVKDGILYFDLGSFRHDLKY